MPVQGHKPRKLVRNQLHQITRKCHRPRPSDYTIFVTPGTATGAYFSGPHSYLGGDRSSFDFIAMSQVIFCPVYVAIRPMSDISVLCAPSTPLLIGLPPRMPW